MSSETTWRLSAMSAIYANTLFDVTPIEAVAAYVDAARVFARAEVASKEAASTNSVLDSLVASRHREDRSSAFLSGAHEVVAHDAEHTGRLSARGSPRTPGRLTATPCVPVPQSFHLRKLLQDFDSRLDVTCLARCA
jgi:hypothetical protein